MEIMETIDSLYKVQSTVVVLIQRGLQACPQGSFLFTLSPSHDPHSDHLKTH